jgi:hypothetical protein
MEQRTRESSLNWENPPLVPKGVINGVAAVVSGKTVHVHMYLHVYTTCVVPVSVRYRYGSVPVGGTY